MEHNTYKTLSFNNYIHDKAAELANDIFIRKYWKHAVIIIGFGLFLKYFHV